MARPPFTMSPSTPTNPTQPAQPMPAARPAAALAPRPVASDKRTLVVGRGISLQGAVQDAERLVVEGTVESPTLRANELEIAPGGLFRGEVEVEDAVVAGTIDGTLTARASLIVRSSGRVMGTARCRRLQVEDGGQITGRIEMITEGTPGSSGASAGSSTPSPLSAPDPQSAPSPLSLSASSQD
ncbi:MAG: polymer-forming cytoskeletal protein [Rhodospirillales bacterium]|nr:polymer-forming cytoskeletal protein [Rhodospirillales bacterium]